MIFTQTIKIQTAGTPVSAYLLDNRHRGKDLPYAEWVRFRWHPNNTTGAIVVWGGPDVDAVDAAAATQLGEPLTPGVIERLDNEDLRDIWFDSDTADSWVGIAWKVSQGLRTSQLTPSEVLNMRRGF